MPLYNSNENNLMSALEDAYREMQEGNLDKFRKAQRERARNNREPDEEKVTVKQEPKKKEFDASMKPVQRLKTRHKRKGEGL